MKKTLVLDFDGVIHSYKSGWKGARNIPDPPVPGALEFIVGALDHFDVCILSSRSHQWGGRWAMKRWLRNQLEAIGNVHSIPEWWSKRIFRSISLEPWNEEVSHAAQIVVGQIRFPLFKPAAHVTIDDRALTFRGRWPTVATIQEFKPWNKKGDYAIVVHPDGSVTDLLK